MRSCNLFLFFFFQCWGVGQFQWPGPWSAAYWGKMQKWKYWLQERILVSLWLFQRYAGSYLIVPIALEERCFHQVKDLLYHMLRRKYMAMRDKSCTRMSPHLTYKGVDLWASWPPLPPHSQNASQENETKWLHAPCGLQSKSFLIWSIHFPGHDYLFICSW